MQNLYIAIATILIWVGSLFFAEYVVSSRPEWPARVASQQKPTYSTKTESGDGRSHQHNGSAGDEVIEPSKANPANPNTERTERREKKDLEAQQSMASSASISWIISLGSAFITLAGVIYVKRTLDATLGTLKEAQKTNVATQRPWLSFESVEIVSGLELRDDDAYIVLILNIKNTGQTPALRVRINDVSWAFHAGKKELEKEEEYVIGITMGGAGVLEYMIPPGAKRSSKKAISFRKELFGRNRDGDFLSVGFTICIGYEFSFERGVHITCENMQIAHRTSGSIHLDKNVIPADELIVSTCKGMRSFAT